MTSDRYRRINRLEQYAHPDEHPMTHTRGLAPLVAYAKLYPTPEGYDPLGDYDGDGSNLSGFTRLLFECRKSIAPDRRD